MDNFVEKKTRPSITPFTTNFFPKSAEYVPYKNALPQKKLWEHFLINVLSEMHILYMANFQNQHMARRGNLKVELSWCEGVLHGC